MARSSDFAWLRLDLPSAISPDAAHESLLALSALAGNPRLVLESTGQGGRVCWHLGGSHAATRQAVATLMPHLPALQVRPNSLVSMPMADRAASVRVAGYKGRQVDISRIEPTTRHLLGALSGAEQDESVRLQIVIGRRRAPQLPSMPQQGAPSRELMNKMAERRVSCVVRVAAKGRSDARTRQLIANVLAALKGLEVPGIRIRSTRTFVSSVENARSPLFWMLHLGITELVPLLAWPITSDARIELPGVPSPHPRRLPVPNRAQSRGRIIGNSLVDESRQLAIGVTDSLRHLHIIGPTGVGKSTLMASLALQDMDQGRGVVVIDPKGDLVDNLLERIPKSRLDDVVVLDPNSSAPIGINPLSGAQPDLAADILLGTMHSLYSESWGPRTQDILHASLLTLARHGQASVVMVPILLTNPGFRRSVIGKACADDPIGLGSFWSWFNGVSDAERAQAIAPLMNKLRPLLLRPGMRSVFGQRNPRFDVSEVFTRRRILLVSLGKGALGAEAAQLLGSVVVSLLWQAALNRVAIPEDRRHPVMIHIDEVQDYLRLPGDISDALAQARGLGVGFTLAHQHLRQLSKPVREAVMANARSRIAFQLAPVDARDLAAITHGRLEAEDFASLPAFHAYASLLDHGNPGDYVSIVTQALQPPLRDAAALKRLSAERFGQPLEQIVDDLANLTETRPGAGPDEPLGRAKRRPRGDS